jgi:hypothetical protein
MTMMHLQPVNPTGIGMLMVTAMVMQQYLK